MKKTILSLGAIITGVLVSAQSGNVGINTSVPAATLDVVGQPTVTTKLDGIMAPRITGDQLFAKTYGAAQNGALVYVTAAASAANQTGQTRNVSLAGYYYYDSAANYWVYMNPAAVEPWLNAATGTPATSSSQNLYTLQHVSIGENRNGPVFNIKNANTAATNNEIFRISTTSKAAGNPESWISLMGNTTTGSFSNTNITGDLPIVFSTDNNADVSANNGIIFMPHVNGLEYGLKFTEQGRLAVNANNPTESLDVKGTARVRFLPRHGSTNSVYTIPGAGTGGSSTQPAPTSPNQPFTATRTVVTNADGVLGYVEGLPAPVVFPTADTSQNKCYASTTQNFSEVSDQSVTQLDFADFSFRYYLTTTGTSSYLQIRNNTTQTLQGYTSPMGGNGSGVGYVTMAPGTWVTMSSALNWDAEYAGRYDFWTDVNTTGAANTGMYYYSISYMGQKRTSTSFPNVCLNVVKH